MGGFGVQVFVPAALAQQSKAGELVFLHTNLVIREDSWTLYGFEREIERDFFILMLGVSGIGPRLALSILSTLSVDVIRRAVLAEQAELFMRVPGIGKNTGQKIVLYLQASGRGEIRQEVGMLDLDTECSRRSPAWGTASSRRKRLSNPSRGKPRRMWKHD